MKSFGAVAGALSESADGNDGLKMDLRVMRMRRLGWDVERGAALLPNFVFRIRNRNRLLITAVSVVVVVAKVVIVAAATLSLPGAPCDGAVDMEMSFWAITTLRKSAACWRGGSR